MGETTGAIGGTVAESATITGTVSSFHPERGLGTITESHGHTLPFHAVALADNSRQIEVGDRVMFRLVPGRLGQWEGSDIVKL